MSFSANRVVLVYIRKYPILLACGLMSFFLLGFLYYRSGSTESEQEQLSKTVEAGKRYISNVANANQLQDQVDFLTQANQAVRARALNADGLAENLQYFYKLESELGIKYNDLRPGSSVAAGKQDNYVPINYTVSIEGSFAQIIIFLKHLEQGAYFCRIVSASVSGSGSKVSLTLNLDLLGIK